MRFACTAACCGIAVGLLVLAIVPIDHINCRIEYSWAAPASPPPRATWAGQTNRLGFRFNRYSDGSGYGWVPLWPAASLMVVVWLIVLRARRWLVAFSLAPLILTLLC